MEVQKKPFSYKFSPTIKPKKLFISCDGPTLGDQEEVLKVKEPRSW